MQSMARTRGIKLLLIALLGLSVIALMPAITPTTQAASQGPRMARLDPDLSEVFRTMQPGDRMIHLNGGRIVQKGDAIRVVVNLRAPAMETFAVRGYPGLGLVKRSVAAAQRRVLSEVARHELDVDVRLDIQYAMAGWATEAGIRKLLSHPDVESIVPDYLNQQLTVQGRAMTRSDYAANTLGYDGTGITVAMIDSATDYLHAELGGATPKSASNPSGSNTICKYMRDFSGNTEVSSASSVVPDDDVYPADFDDGYHSTGTSAIVHRYAPGAKLVLLKVFPNAYDSVIANAINWCVTNKNIVSGSPIALINMSLGGGKYTGSCSTGTMQSAIDNAKSAGVVSFVAAGNDGYTNAMGAPACDPDVIAMGSVWDANNCNYSAFPPAYCSDSTRNANERACYSDASPELDLYAPSEEVITAQVFGGTFALGGTSSATPAAAGLAAQLLHAKPALKGDMAGIKSLFQTTGVAITGNPNSSYQNKRIDVTAAIQYGSGTTPVVNSFSASPSSITSGGSSTLSWSCSNTTSVAISGVSGTFGASGSTTVYPTSTTTYTLTATGSGGTATASTTVTVTTSGGSTEVEPNGARSSANTLSNGVNLTGYVGTSTDSDYFKISIGPRKTVTITLQVPYDKDYDLKLYDSSGYTLKSSTKDTGISELITYQNTSSSYTRTYYIRVYGYSGAYSTTSSYTLKASW